MQHAVVDPQFGARMRHLREERGLSLRELGKRVSYSHVYLWQIEAGDRPPPPDVVQRVDDALDAAGALVTLIDTGPDLRCDEAARVSHVTARPRMVDQATLDILAQVLDHYRRLEDVVGAAAVWRPVHAQLALAQQLLTEAPNDLRTAAADVAAQHARQVAWLTLATGRRGAAALFRRTAVLAEEAGTVDLVAMARSYLGHLAWFAGRPSEVIVASRHARSMPAYVGERAYDALQEARGQAMRGDVRQVDRLLAEGHDLAAETAEYDGPIPPWQYYRSAAFFALERGLVLAVLARHGDRRHALRAVVELTAGAEGLPAEQRGADWYGEYLVFLAECQARLGNATGSAATVAEVRRIAAATGSGELVRRVARIC